nr:MAG TPA: hypothetical protein [Caudoviricetes sp.]
MDNPDSGVFFHFITNSIDISDCMTYYINIIIRKDRNEFIRS